MLDSNNLCNIGRLDSKIISKDNEKMASLDSKDSKNMSLDFIESKRLDSKAITESTMLDSRENIESTMLDSKSAYKILLFMLLSFSAADCIESRAFEPKDALHSDSIESKNPFKILMLADNDTESNNAKSVESTQDSKDSNDTKNATKDSNESIESYRLNAVTTTANSPLRAYQSGESVGRQMLDSNPSGNGDITSILKILPNVQYDNAQLKSTTPGEIDPANISISGGLFYQNNFQLDGFNMNNDLDPISGSSTSGSGGASQGMRSGQSQGFNVDTSLLDSINVLDSNVSAAYGRFTGGVVEANVRKARKDIGPYGSWHGNISYQYTSDKLTQYFIAPSVEAEFVQSSDENYQPHFTKHLVRASLEGYALKDLGILASFTTTQSFIPLQGFNAANSYKGTGINQTQDQKRQSYNYYMKAHYNPLESLNIEATIAYMPQDNTYFTNIAKDSFYTMKSGGLQTGIKTLWDNKIGLWTNTLGYNFMESSRRSDKNYYLVWRYSEGDKNWASSSINYVNEGGLSNVDQMQHTLNYKSDMSFNEISFWRINNFFRTGFELSYQSVNRDITDNYYFSPTNGVQQLTGNCPANPWGLSLCSSAPAWGTNNATGPTWNNGQYITRINVIEANQLHLDSVSYGIYLEDDIKIDLENYGSISIRPGLRLDGDNYMDKHTLAYRFAMNYAMPFASDYKSIFIFGANRYYGRNLFSYRLADSILSQTKSYNYTAANGWAETSVNAASNTNFSKLEVPYEDEIIFGITQNLWIFGLNAKYIHREGRNEITRKNNGPVANTSCSANIQCYYTNDGTSSSDIITISIQNIKPINTWGINHQYLFAFDWTNTKRSYNLWATDNAYEEDVDIKWNGVVMKYSQRPVQNFTRPYTIRLNTTHTFNIWRTKWMWNNFFRFRAPYDAIVAINNTHPMYDPNFGGGVAAYRSYQYATQHFKGAFTWDMRFGFEVDVWRKNTLYVNVDIYNVLNTQNMTTLSNASGTINPSILPSGSTVAVYEIGRQFWLQVGYKF